MRSLVPALLAFSLIVPAAMAQNVGAGTEGRERGRNMHSFVVRNDSRSVVASVKLVSTNGGQVMFQAPNPIQPSESAEVQVGRDECLAEVDVSFKDGRTLRQAGLNECKLTRISIGDNNIQLENSAVH